MALLPENHILQTGGPVAEARIHAIFLAPKAKQPPLAVAEVKAIAGKGLEGDRYSNGRGSLSRWPGAARQVSLIALEAILAVGVETGLDLGDGQHRRNIVTEGVDLPALKGLTFRIGTAVLRGVGLCQLCGHLERLTEAGVFAALKGRGGLRAEVLVEGIIRTGDGIEILAETLKSPLNAH
jgi:MOSC domain-containing protein YiiM